MEAGRSQGSELSLVLLQWLAGCSKQQEGRMDRLLGSYRSEGCR